jgi:hypothetical protein
MRKTEPVTVKIEKDGSMDDKIESHPAFGSAMFCRTTHGGMNGHTHLFGSSLTDHPTTIHLRINRAERRTWSGVERVFDRDELIEVEFSAAQFAELLTTMNFGAGIPCTIRHIAGESIPEIPDEDGVAVDRIIDAFKEGVSKHVLKLQEIENQIKTITEKASIGKADRKELRDLAYQARRYFVDNAPFMVQVFHEASEKSVTAAKAEIEAAMTQAVHKAGLEHLQQLPVKSVQMNQLNGVYNESCTRCTQFEECLRDNPELLLEEGVCECFLEKGEIK